MSSDLDELLGIPAAPKHTYAAALIGGQANWERKHADYYPTPPDVTWALLDHLALAPGRHILEPACGDGAISEVLTAAGHKVTSTDLHERGYGQGGVDFLRAPFGWHDWTITNPPFKLAAAFIERSMTVSSNVAMLLKSQYWHARSRLDLFEAHPPAEVLPLTWRPSFLEAERGKSPLMDVIWVVWRAGEITTSFTPLRRPAGNSLKCVN